MRTFKASRIQHGIAHVTLDGRTLSLRLDLRRHSPTGPEWGYGGSGPAQLALAMCCAVAGDERGQNVYQDFKAKVLASIQQDEWEMTEEQVLRVVEGIEAARLAGHTA